MFVCMTYDFSWKYLESELHHNNQHQHYKYNINKYIAPKRNYYISKYLYTYTIEQYVYVVNHKKH